MKVYDVHDFNAKAASREFLKHGFIAVDDISGGLVDCAEDELLDALGFAADELDLGIEELSTSWGPVFVFWDRGRGTLAAAKAFVFTQRKPS